MRVPNASAMQCDARAITGAVEEKECSASRLQVLTHTIEPTTKPDRPMEGLPSVLCNPETRTKSDRY